MDAINPFYIPTLTEQAKRIDEQLFGVEESGSHSNNRIIRKKVFIVHGHDEIRHKLATWLTKNGLGYIFLDEKPSRSRPILQKLLDFPSEASFAIILMTADDIGREKNDVNGSRYRARQNVILELGYFIGRIGAKNVHVAAHKEIEIPTDWTGIINSWIEGGEFIAFKNIEYGSVFISRY